MKILYIKAGKIFEDSGGGIESKKIFYSLERYSKENKDVDFKCISSDIIDDIQLKRIRKNKIKDILSRFFLHASFVFIDWKFFKLKETINDFNPDIIILANSRLGFIAKYIKKNMPKVQIIGHFDNIEYDYVEGYFKEKKGLINRIIKQIEKYIVKFEELNFSLNIDIPVFLTDRDAYRAKKLYGLEFENSKIIPICIKRSGKELYKFTQNTINLVFLGSLWYMSNINAIKWFLENVWNDLLNHIANLYFIIGGSNPSSEFKRYIKQYKNVVLYENYNDKSDIIPINSIFISPILTGAGMKVKIAEALEMGLMVIGSKESLVGYSEALYDKANTGIIIEANTALEYKKEILKGIKNFSNLNNIRNNSKILFEKYYSIDRAYYIFKDIIDYIDKKNKDL